LNHKFLWVARLETVALLVVTLLAYRGEVAVPVLSVAQFSAVFTNLFGLFAPILSAPTAFPIPALHFACG
jgi:hypothetical protein